MATAFMRLPSVSVTISGIASVITVAIAPTAANSIASKRVSPSVAERSSAMTPASEIEMDHLAHDHDANQHPGAGANQHQAPGRMGPQQLDIVRAGQIDERHHRRRQAADD